MKELKKSNKELNDFAHIVSHDLKSPLRSMNTLVYWIMEGLQDQLKEEEKSNFALLLKKIDRMDLLIEGILSYASIDKLQVKPKEVNLQIVLDDLLETIYIPETIEIISHNKLPILTGDSFKFTQLFQNLLSNAIKYNDKPKGRVEVFCAKKKNEYLFEIRDNGIGIKEKYFQKIFDVFEVLEVSDNSTGVGLSIVKKIVEFYGGTIWLSSEFGKGTSFFFTLPK